MPPVFHARLVLARLGSMAHMACIGAWELRTSQIAVVKLLLKKKADLIDPKAHLAPALCDAKWLMMFL